MNFNKLDDNERNEIMGLFQKAGSADRVEAEAAARKIATAVETPLRKTLLSGDNLGNIFEVVQDNGNLEFPLDILTPGDEAGFYAYVIPSEGRIPERRVEGDYLRVPTYSIGNSIDCQLRFLRDANWPVLQRMIEVLEGGFVKKMNDDGWQTLITAATDRNMVIFDANAAAGQFTPRLITLMSTTMRRNGGGNATTNGRSRLTDMYISPEAHMDIRAWGLDLVSDPVRSNIYYADENDPDLINVFGVNLHAYDEFGEDQDYQNYYTTTLGASMPSNGDGGQVGDDVEICVGLDRSRSDSFVNPVREDLQIFEDNTMHRRRLFGLYGTAELGFAVLDSRRTLLGSM